MGDYEQHTAKAAETENFARWLLDTTGGLAEDEAACQSRLCWTVTAAFYSALHLVHARLALRGIHPTSHRGPGGTLTLVRIEDEFAPIRTDYKRLIDLSEQARYWFPGFEREQVALLLDESLVRVKQYTQSLEPS